MAKTKQDYYNDGRDVARSLIVAGAMQGYENGYPVSNLDGKPLNASMNGSWQAKAWRQGFDSERAGYVSNIKVLGKWPKQSGSKIALRFAKNAHKL